MLNILDLPPELLIVIYNRLLDSTSLRNRHLAHLRFSKTCRTFKDIADTRICLYINTTSRLAALGDAIDQWNSSRCTSVDSIVLADLHGCLEVLWGRTRSLSKLNQLQLLAVEIGDLTKPEDLVSFNQVVCSLGTLTTLNLNYDSNSSIEVTAESVSDYLHNLPELQHLVLPFITTLPTFSSYLMPRHPLRSLKLSLNGLRGCDFLTALLPVLSKLDSLFLGVLPSHPYDDEAPINEIGEVGSDFDDEVLERLAGTLERHGQTLETFGFAAAVPYGWWYSSSTWEYSEFVKIYEVLPAFLQHILITPQGSHLRYQLPYLSHRFPNLRHLTITSETLPDDSENSGILSDSDLIDLVDFCKDSPTLEKITFKNIGMYRPPHGVRQKDPPSLTWAEMVREAAAVNVIIEDVDRYGDELE